MRERALRIILWIMAAVALEVGVWATFAPRSFYDDFPGGGAAWVSPDGPFNEHLVRDVGELNLALAVVTVAAAITIARWAVVTAALAWLVYGVPHLVYHLRHLDAYDGSDQPAVVISLAIAPIAAVAVLWLGGRKAPAEG